MDFVLCSSEVGIRLAEGPEEEAEEIEKVVVVEQRLLIVLIGEGGGGGVAVVLILDSIVAQVLVARSISEVGCLPETEVATVGEAVDDGIFLRLFHFPQG